jgi:hypothetical protein
MVGDTVKVTLYGVITSLSTNYVTVETDWGSDYEFDRAEVVIEADD